MHLAHLVPDQYWSLPLLVQIAIPVAFALTLAYTLLCWSALDLLVFAIEWSIATAVPTAFVFLSTHDTFAGSHGWIWAARLYSMMLAVVFLIELATSGMARAERRVELIMDRIASWPIVGNLVMAYRLKVGMRAAYRYMKGADRDRRLLEGINRHPANGRGDIRDINLNGAGRTLKKLQADDIGDKHGVEDFRVIPPRGTDR